KKEIIDQRAATHRFAAGNILSPAGIGLFDGNNYSREDYFKAAMNGNAYVSEPLVSAITKEVAFVVAAPLWEGGIPNTKVVGVITFSPQPAFLNDAVNSIHVSENSSAYMVNANGTTIAHKDMERVIGGENVAALAVSNPALSVLADIHTKMASGAADFESYSFDGVEKFIAYAPVGNSNGWSLAINAPTSDFMDATVMSVAVTLALMVFSLLAAAFFALRMANRIGKPMTACTQRLALLATGDLQTPVPEIHSKDETGKLAESTSTIVAALTAVVDDVDYLLDSMADGNFNVKSKNAAIYVKDFLPMLLSMRKINEGLSDTLQQINVASEQVSSGSQQVSSGAQALSQGATEQASAVEELAATIGEISDQIQRTAQNAATASRKSNQAGNEVGQSNAKMQELIAAMAEISRSSKEIGKVIKTIEDIAFQTN
ncbi:MAG: cache domain-containing protein, partial [Oscillospiraceae bacterium]